MSLFQLLCVVGDWERAMTQLNVSGDMDAGAIAMVHTYRDLLQVEALRARVVPGEDQPTDLRRAREMDFQVDEALRIDSLGEPGKAQKLALPPSRLPQLLAARSMATVSSGSLMRIPGLVRSSKPW